MKKLLDYLVKNSTGIKDFKIEEDKIDNETTFTVKAPKESLGLLIGKNGRTIKSIRRLLKVKATLENIKVNLIVSLK